MIDEKKLIEFCRNVSIPDGNLFIDDLVIWIEGQPKFGEWIPISERLPEEEGVYLRTCESAVEMVAFNPVEEFDVDEWKSTVTAWMPLPEPWEGEK